MTMMLRDVMPRKRPYVKDYYVVEKALNITNQRV